MSVEYRDIPGYPGYRAGSDGSVWSRFRNRKGVLGEYRKLKGYKNFRGYIIYGLRPTGYPMLGHRLVAMAFISQSISTSDVVRHLDGNPSNNRLENLKVGTQLENIQDKVRHGTMASGSKNGNSTLTEDDVREIKRLYVPEKFGSLKLSRKFNVGNSTIKHILTGRTWAHIN